MVIYPENIEFEDGELAEYEIRAENLAAMVNVLLSSSSVIADFSTVNIITSPRFIRSLHDDPELSQTSPTSAFNIEDMLNRTATAWVEIPGFSLHSYVTETDYALLAMIKALKNLVESYQGRIIRDGHYVPTDPVNDPDDNLPLWGDMRVEFYAVNKPDIEAAFTEDS
jgi:hypothetical protein